MFFWGRLFYKLFIIKVKESLKENWSINQDVCVAGFYLGSAEYWTASVEPGCQQAYHQAGLVSLTVSHSPGKLSLLNLFPVLSTPTIFHFSVITSQNLWWVFLWISPFVLSLPFIDSLHVLCLSCFTHVPVICPHSHINHPSYTWPPPPGWGLWRPCAETVPPYGSMTSSIMQPAGRTRSQQSSHAPSPLSPAPASPPSHGTQHMKTGSSVPHMQVWLTTVQCFIL